VCVCVRVFFSSNQKKIDRFYFVEHLLLLLLFFFEERIDKCSSECNRAANSFVDLYVCMSVS